MDTTPRQRDFRANEMNEASNDELAGEEPWATPAAFEKSKSIREVFEDDTDSNSGSESDHSEGGDMGRGNKGRGHRASKTFGVGQSKLLVDFVDGIVDGMSKNGSQQPLPAPHAVQNGMSTWRYI